MRHGRKRAPSGNCIKCDTWRQSLHTDHIKPTWNGGADTDDNKQLICANCHEDKTWAERATAEYKAFVSEQVRKRMLSKEARERISLAVRAANARRVWTEESRQRCSRKGIKRGPMSQATKDKLSAAHIGKPLSSEHRRALREARQRVIARQAAERKAA